MFLNSETISRQAEIKEFIGEVAGIFPHADLSKKCDAFVTSFPPEDALAVAALIGGANPFYLPNIPDEHLKQLSVNTEQFLNALMRTRLTLERSNHLNILVACMPKTASTFITSCIHQAFSLEWVNLSVPAHKPSEIGAHLKEQEPDEIALIRAGMMMKGYVAQHHMRLSPYVARLLQRYNVKPIVLFRNILDVIVSADDMIMEYRLKMSEKASHFFSDGLPQTYHKLSRDERLLMFAQHRASWLVRFYVSWKKHEAYGLIRPLWISYEDDFLTDKKMMVAKIIAYLGQQEKVVPTQVLRIFEDKSDSKDKRINLGIAGRGADAPSAVKDLIKDMTYPFKDELDMTPIIGDL